MGAAVLWVRWAGLPARVLAGLGDSALPALLDEMESLRETGAAMRRQAADLLYAQIPLAKAAERRVLLALRRDTHQGRPLAGYREEPCWTVMDVRLGGLLERIADIDDQLAAQEAVFEAACADVQESERRAIFAAAESAWFHRGLALAAPAVVEALERHRSRPSTGRKARRLEASLLRYVSRAALKLSPYSTLTPLALAEVQTIKGEDAVAYFPQQRCERSLMRIKRYLLDQCWRLLVRHPPLRLHLRVGLNPSCESLEGGQYRFLRLSSLTRAGAGAEDRLEKAPPAHVTVRLEGEMVPCFRRLLARTDLPWPALLAAAEDELGAGPEEGVARAVEQLLEIGFLELKPPWPGYEPWLERRLLELLTAVADPALASIAEILAEIVELEKEFASAPDPAGVVRRLDDRAVSLYAAIGAAVDPEGSPPLAHTESRSYYEDVFVAPRTETAPFLLKLDREPLARTLAVGDLVWRLGSAFEPRHELLIALERHWATHHAGESHIPLMQLWAESRPLWAAYRRHRDHGVPGPFDPFSSPEIREIEWLRTSLQRRLGGVIEFDGQVETVPVEAYRALAQEVPSALLSPIDPCLFLQPCDPQGELWVANLCCEGSGRMTCRFNVLLEADERLLLERHWLPGTLRDGEEVEIVDLLFTRGNTVNLHWPMHRVILSPGESADLPPERVLRLADLQVRRRAGQPLSLHDPAGRRIVPCFLSPLTPRLLPVALRFLGIFGGQSEVELPVPPLSQRVEQREGWSVRPRQVIDNLVVRRRSWQIGRDLLPTARSGTQVFSVWHRQRRRWEMPDQVYVTIMDGEGAAAKPQYIDFRSPSFLDLLAGAAQHGSGPLTMVEALPRPDELPMDPQEGPRAFEVMLEGLRPG